MLFALIATAWLTVATLCLAVCAMAARADADSSSHANSRKPATSDGLVVWESLPELAVQDAELTAHGVR